MEMTEFRTLDDVRLHRDRLRALRAGHLDGIKGHWGTLREKEFRAAVVNGFFRDLWDTWKPMNTVGAVLGSNGDLVSTALGLFMGKRARSPWGRMLFWAAGAVVPMLAKKIGGTEKAQHMLDNLRASWERIKEYLEERREAHRERHTAEKV